MNFLSALNFGQETFHDFIYYSPMENLRAKML